VILTDPSLRVVYGEENPQRVWQPADNESYMAAEAAIPESYLNRAVRHDFVLNNRRRDGL